MKQKKSQVIPISNLNYVLCRLVTISHILKCKEQKSKGLLKGQLVSIQIGQLSPSNKNRPIKEMKVGELVSIKVDQLSSKETFAVVPSL